MTQQSEPDIDFRPYVQTLLKNWYWILGLGLVAGLLAYFGTRLLVSPTYEATALVSVIELRQRVQFDPRIVTEEQTRPARAYLEIALSDELLSRLRDDTPAAASYSLQRIRSMLTATAGSDPSLIRLTARNADPALAAELANGLAEELVGWANGTYGALGEDQLRFFEQRLEEATADVDAREQALVDFQAGNRAPALENEFLTLKQTHADLLAKQREIDSLLRDIDSLLAAATSGGRGAAVDDQVTALILRLRAFGGPSSTSPVAPPWQLQINAGPEGEGGADLVEQVTALRAALEVQAEQTAAAVLEIEPRMLAVQQEQQEAMAAEARLQREIDLAVETQTTLARTVEEKRITSHETDTSASVASRSAVPAFPRGPRTSFNALAAFLGMALLATFVLIIRTWWRLSTEPAEAVEPPAVAGSAEAVIVGGDR